MTAIVDIEPEVKAFLVDKGIADPIYLQAFPEDSAAKGIMIRTTGLPGPLPFEVPVDAHRVEIVARDAHPKDALTLATSIANIVHAATAGQFHPASTLFLLGAFMDERPQRRDNEDRELHESFAFFVFRVRTL